MRFLLRSLSGLFITFLTFGLLFLAGFQVWQAVSTEDDSGRPGRGGGEQVYTTRLLTITPQAVNPVMRVFGSIESRRRLELRAGAAGQIVYLDPALQEGGQVGKGQQHRHQRQAPAKAVVSHRHDRAHCRVPRHQPRGEAAQNHRECLRKEEQVAARHMRVAVVGETVVA